MKSVNKANKSIVDCRITTVDLLLQSATYRAVKPLSHVASDVIKKNKPKNEKESNKAE